jgi:hypothetical protein
MMGRLILYVPPILQQIQISVDQPYAGPAASCCGINGTHSILVKDWADRVVTHQLRLAGDIFTSTSAAVSATVKFHCIY